MGLLGNSISVTRFAVSVPPDGPDFERARFWAIEPGSEVRERKGFVPFELEAPWEIGIGGYAFRLRIDRIKPDATAVKERLRELVKAEMEATGKPFVGAKTRRKLRELAEAELSIGVQPRTTIVECCIDGQDLYVASTAKAHLGLVITILRQAGVEAEFRAPWLEPGAAEEKPSEIALSRQPGESIEGCRFLRALLDDPEVMVEPETGSVKLATREGRVSLTGAVLNDLHRYLDEGAEILSAKIHLGKIPLRFEALSYRLAGVKLPPIDGDHWTLQLDQRLEALGELFGALDRKYSERMPQEEAAAGEEKPGRSIAGQILDKMADALEKTAGAPVPDGNELQMESITFHSPDGGTRRIDNPNLKAAMASLKG